jgi:asparagine synthase (glutamine-hydrolysing)
VAAAMAQAMHAGEPDGVGIWCDASVGVALAQRQLSVRERFAPVKQPAVSSCGRYVLACEGEVYNVDELIVALRAAGRTPADACDAHVIVEAVAAWGLESALGRLNAVFVGALWDRESRALHLFRDRFGMHPLYWSETGGLFLFASALKALRACADFSPALDRDSLAAFLRRRGMPGPHTIYRGVRMLEPGSILSIEAKGTATIRSYWVLEEIVRAGQAERFAGSPAEAMDRFDGLLRDAVARRAGNASVGVFLSGGIDSAALLAVLQAVAPDRALSFSAGFHEPGYDETEHARAVARHLGVRHEAFYVSASHAGELIPRLPDIYDEPMADISQIPTYFLAKLARQEVSFAITGDGAESFDVSNQYLSVDALLRHLRRLPRPACQAATMLVRHMPAAFLSRIPASLPTALQPLRIADKLRLLARMVAGDAEDRHRLTASYWQDPDELVIDGREPPGLTGNPRLAADIPNAAERMQYIGMMTILSDCLLTKVERAASAVDLRIRMPFLDHRLVEFGWSLPAHMKQQGGTNKWLLLQILHRYVPPAIVDRPKMGFDVPMGNWLRGPLRDWAEGLLAERRLTAEGIFNPRPIRQRWREHLEGRRNWQGSLWVILMFQAWKERWLP